MSRLKAPYGLTWPHTSGVRPHLPADVMRAIHSGSDSTAASACSRRPGRLEQVQRVHGHPLVVQPIAGHFTALAKEDKPVGRVPGLDHVQPLVDFAPERLLAEIAAQEGGLERLAQLSERLIGWVLDVAAGEATQDR